MSSPPTGGTVLRAADEDTKPQSQGEETEQDVWAELFGVVQGLAETVGLALQAFTPSDDKAVSAITKKRLALRSLQGLKQGQTDIQTLLEHLKALQAASRTWQRSMMFASKSHQELMEQVESTTAELHATNERLRIIEAQRIAAVRDAESLRSRSSQQEALIKELQSQLKHREEELETLQFTAHEAQVSATEAMKELERLGQAATAADERAQAAATTVEEARAEAAKAHGLAERHQQVVAKLTADNLVFLMQLKKAEADLAAANQERAQLRLAAEKQRGPWFDQVRAGVEERVREALQRSQELELQIERMRSEHTNRMEAVHAERERLGEELQALRRHADELQDRLTSSNEQQQRAESLSAAAEGAVREIKQRLDEMAAENRVLQESVRSMRQECTERWVSEQAALSQVGGLEERIQELERLLSAQAAQAAGLQRQLETQMGVNRQLMARKEEVEWQLMAAMAKVDGGNTDGPVPLNLQVSGMLQVGGSGAPGQRTNTEPSGGGGAGARPLAKGGAAGLSPVAASTAVPHPLLDASTIAAGSEAHTAWGQGSLGQAFQRGRGNGQGAPEPSVGLNGGSKSTASSTASATRVDAGPMGPVPQPQRESALGHAPNPPPTHGDMATQLGATRTHGSSDANPYAHGTLQQHALAAPPDGQVELSGQEDRAQQQYRQHYADHKQQQDQRTDQPSFSRPSVEQPGGLGLFTPPHAFGSGGGEDQLHGHANTLSALQPEPTLLLPTDEVCAPSAGHSNHNQASGSACHAGDLLVERDPTERGQRRQEGQAREAYLGKLSSGAGAGTAPPSAYTVAPTAGSRRDYSSGPLAGAASSVVVTGAGTGVGNSAAMGGSAPARLASAEVEGASTGPSSPTSSVALSTDPGSVQRMSYMASATSSSMDGMPAGPTAPEAAAVTIRTVSTGPRRQPQRPQEASASRGTTEQVWEEGAFRQVAPSLLDRGDDATEGAGRSTAVGGADDQDCLGHGGAAATEPLVRRGSLHEGGDIWFADDASSSSSDDSDFFASGVVVQRGVGGGAHPSQPPPHQALLHQLQQQLQAHLQAPVPKAEAKGAAAQGQQETLVQVHQDRAPLGGAKGDDGDVIQVRPGHRQAAELSGGNGASRLAVSVRTTPMQTGASRAGDSPTARAFDLGFDGMYGRIDPTGGVFSIVKSRGGPIAARTGASESPVHPALSAATARGSASTAGGGSPTSSPQLRVGSAAAGDGSAADGHGRQTAAAVMMTTHSAPPGRYNSAAHTAEPPSVALEPAIPSRVQAGPPFYATAGPLHGSSVTAFERWSSSHSQGGRGPQPQPPAQALALAPRLQPLEAAPIPLRSPTWSSATRSPRSPTHPAMCVAGELRSPSSQAAAPAPRSEGSIGAVAMAGRGRVAALDWSGKADGYAMRTGRSDGQDPAAMGTGADTPTTTAAVRVTAAAMEAGARPRVSFHGISQAGTASRDEASDGADLSCIRVNAFSSSIGSASFHVSNGPANTSTGLQPQKSGSVKSVRFSDHEADDDMSRQQRGPSDNAIAAGSTRSNLRMYALRSGNDVPGRPQVSRGAASYGSQPAMSSLTEPYRSQGPVPHPAITATSTSSVETENATVNLNGGDAGGHAQSSRISAARVVTTAAPRGTTTS